MRRHLTHLRAVKVSSCPMRKVPLSMAQATQRLALSERLIVQSHDWLFKWWAWSGSFTTARHPMMLSSPRASIFNKDVAMSVPKMKLGMLPACLLLVDTPQQDLGTRAKSQAQTARLR